jgi:hypothetical protein
LQEVKSYKCCQSIVSELVGKSEYFDVALCYWNLILFMPHMCIQCGRSCGTHGTGRIVYKVLVGKSEGKRPLGRPRPRRQDGIRIDLRETGAGM